MKTWKKITILTTVTGVALGVLAYFAKKKSLEDDFSDEFVMLLMNLMNLMMK